MMNSRYRLEAEFLQLCRARGPDWIASVLRPLRLPGHFITVCDIPTRALAAAIHAFK